MSLAKLARANGEGDNVIIINNLPSSIKRGGDTSDATATSDDILLGKTAYSKNQKIEGTIPTIEGRTVIPTDENQTINGNAYLNGDIIVGGDPALISDNIKAGVTIFNIEGNPNVVDTTISKSAASSSYVQRGRVCYVNGKKITGAADLIVDSGSDTLDLYITNDDQTIEGPKFLEKNTSIVVHGEPNLTADNIKAGVTIGDITGSYTGGDPFDFSEATITTDTVIEGYKGFDNTGSLITGTAKVLDTSDATAVSTDMKAGVTAYVNGEKITGDAYTRQPFTITVDGTDHWLKEGFYMGLTIPGEPNLIPSNVKKGVTIYGVEGTYKGGSEITKHELINTVDFTSAQEVYEYFNNGDDCWCTNTTDDQEKLTRISNEQVWGNICCSYDTDGVNYLAGVDIRPAFANAKILLRPVTLSSSYGILYSTSLLSGWIQPTIVFHLLPESAITIAADGTYARVDMTQSVFSKNVNLTPAFNMHRSLIELENLPVGTYCPVIVIPDCIQGNICTIGELGIMEI